MDECIIAQVSAGCDLRIKPNMLGFSFSFDLDFSKIFKIIENCRLELKSSLRKEDDPIIFAGGPVVTANPMPYKDIFDFMIIFILKR